MAMIFKLRMLSHEDENFIRDYELSYTMSLMDFHYFICDDLGYDKNNMSSFFTSNESWEKLQEFTLMDMGLENSEDAPIPMEEVALGQLFRKNNDRLIYTFDPFEDRAMFLELAGAEKSKDEFSYPRVAFENGEAPNQFDADASPVNKSIFEEVMDDFGDFGDPGGGDEFMDDFY